MSEALKIGSPIDCEQFRDAIHVAVAPVVAGEGLNPAERIALNGNGEAVRAKKAVGIVDPYLQSPIRKGQKFWMFLMPGSVTSLRHEWTHPAFREQAIAAPALSNEVDESVAWLKNFANEDVGLRYDRILEIGREAITSGSAFVGGDNEQDVFNEQKDEFLKHVAIVLGLKSPDRNDVYFSCAC